MDDPPPPTAKALWGDEKFSDATIVMGQKTWHVHRWVVCQQSKYFDKALEGNFKASSGDLLIRESKEKKINLTGSPFTEEEVDDMLKYLYLQELGKRQIKCPISTFFVADYFQVRSLCTMVATQFTGSLVELIRKGFLTVFKAWCHVVLGKHEGTILEKAVIAVLAGNIKWVMHESHAWDELTNTHPKLAKKIMQELYPKSEESRVKRPACLAFDDILEMGRESNKRRSGSSYN